MERKTGQKGTIKKKSNLLQKSYYQKKSRETQYPGNIWIDPKPKDYTAIKERVERNPSRKGLKSEKNRKSFYRASSNLQHKSLGAQTVYRGNQNLNLKYNSKTQSQSKGNNQIKPLSVNYRKSSRKVQNSSGNIFVQPAAKRKNYDEIKARVERNPERSMARQLNRQKDITRSNTSLTQSYKGNINIKAIQSKRQTYRYDSRVIQQSSGNLSARRVKFNAGTRKLNSSLSANYKGSIALPSRNYKRMRYEYMSKVAQKNSGEMKRGAKSPGPQYTSTFSGDIRSNDKRGTKQWAKYQSKQQTSYRGDLKASKSLRKPGGNTQITQHVGGIRIYSAQQRKKTDQYNSKSISSYEGDTRVISRRKQSRMMANEAHRSTTFAGNIKTRTQKQKNQSIEGKSLSLASYGGDIKVLSKNRQDRFMLRDSKVTLKYTGTIKGLTPDQKKQALEGKSLILADYQGNIKTRVRTSEDKKQTRTNVLSSGFKGDIIITAKERKKLEYEYLSKVQHNYRGEINQKKYNSWLENRQAKSAVLSSYQGNIKTSQQDLREKQFEHMSKTAHNFRGNLRVDNNYARNRYYRNISDRNQQFTGNFRMKTPLAKDIEQQLISARVHNYEGGPKTSFFNRIWLSLFDNSGKLEKMDDRTKKPKYDSREYKIWY